MSSPITIVREFNKWRRGDESLPQPNPVTIGVAIEEVIGLAERAEELQREVTTLKFDAVKQGIWMDTAKDKITALIAAGEIMEMALIQSKALPSVRLQWDIVTNAIKESNA